jgi:hypothetical protein
LGLQLHSDPMANHGSVPNTPEEINNENMHEMRVA